LEAKDQSKPVFWGFMAIGFLSLIGGILVFIYVVPKDIDPDAAPRDATVLFTEVYLQQLQFFQSHQRYAAALGEVSVDQETCNRYNCRLTVRADAKDFIFRISKDNKTWMITPKSPVPKLEK
jgi:hypothetical protein